MAPRDRPEDRPFLTRGIRALELLWDLANAGQAGLPGSVQEYLEAAIVVPEQVIPRPKAIAPGGQLPAPTAPRSHFRTLEEMNPAVQHIVAAMTDVRQAARAHLDSIVEQQDRRQPSISPPGGIEPRRSRFWGRLGAREDDVPVTTPATLPEPPWALGSSGAQRLQESTRQTLRELGIAYETRNYTEVIQELENRADANRSDSGWRQAHAGRAHRHGPARYGPTGENVPRDLYRTAKPECPRVPRNGPGSVARPPRSNDDW